MTTPNPKALAPAAGTSEGPGLPVRARLYSQGRYLRASVDRNHHGIPLTDLSAAAEWRQKAELRWTLIEELTAECERLRAALAAGSQAVPVWQDIATAPDGELLVVGWLDPEDEEHPERHDFDWLEDGAWQRHADNYEHFCMAAPAGSRGPSEEAPYTHWMRLGAIPTAPSLAGRG
jgi:hypothetical protein